MDGRNLRDDHRSSPTLDRGRNVMYSMLTLMWSPKAFARGVIVAVPANVAD